MPIPAKILPAEQTIKPNSGSASIDGWSIRVYLDPTRDWSGSTFAADPAPFRVDATHKVDQVPYVDVYLTPADILGLTERYNDWNLSEDTVLARTFIAQQLEVVSR